MHTFLKLLLSQVFSNISLWACVTSTDYFKSIKLLGKETEGKVCPTSIIKEDEVHHYRNPERHASVLTIVQRDMRLLLE
jgi:hypothetical protein